MDSRRFGCSLFPYLGDILISLGYPSCLYCPLAPSPHSSHHAPLWLHHSNLWPSSAYSPQGLQQKDKHLQIQNGWTTRLKTKSPRMMGLLEPYRHTETIELVFTVENTRFYNILIKLIMKSLDIDISVLGHLASPYWKGTTKTGQLEQRR